MQQIIASIWAVLLGAGLANTSAQTIELRPLAEDQVWRMPVDVPFPVGNRPTPERIALGKMLFFDTRLSGDNSMACASCHSPQHGWSDGNSLARGSQGTQLTRRTPSIVNAAFNSSQMWDGGKSSLEDQALSPLESPLEMHTDFPRLLSFLKSTPAYVAAFASAYPDEAVDASTISRALASFERSLIAADSRFDRWLRGEPGQMAEAEIRGFRTFVDPVKGNCAACHKAPLFMDSGFHNIGLKSFGDENPDLGRYAIKPVAIMKGAFKTPSLRRFAPQGPYFHDGSAGTLSDVVAHYTLGGVVKLHLAPDMKPLDLSAAEQDDLVAFLKALQTEDVPFNMPSLP